MPPAGRKRAVAQPWDKRAEEGGRRDGRMDGRDLYLRLRTKAPGEYLGRQVKQMAFNQMTEWDCGSLPCALTSSHTPEKPGATQPRHRRSRGFAYEQEITRRRVSDPVGQWRAAPGQLSSRGLIPLRILRAKTLPTQEVATMDRHTRLNGKYHWPTGFFIS